MHEATTSLLESMGKEDLKKLLVTLDDRPSLAELKTLLIEKIKTAS